MPNYTVEDTETGKKVTFEWTGEDSPTDDDMLSIFAEARKQAPEPKPELPKIGDYGRAMKTNIGTAETMANLATATYGIPLSGLAGLLALPFGLEAAREATEVVQKGLVYQPQTQAGQELTRDVTYPIQKLDQAGGYVGGKLEDAGYPMLGAAAHTVVVGAPVIAGGGRALTRPSPAKAAVKIDTNISKAIDHGINKAIRPSVVKKELHGQVVAYRNKARTAVHEIVKNKDNLNMLDESGARVEGLPKTLDQFSQAIEQTKRGIFVEYDNLAKQSGKVGVKIDLGSIANKIDPAVRSKVLADLSPETIEYAVGRMEVLTERGFYTAAETQEAIQLLNQTLEKFYRDPSPKMKGQAFVDALIANNLRKSLDTAINNVTGKNYQALKNKYGALRTIEKDVTKRSIVDARKNMKGLIDFSDVYTGYHITKGILAAEPSTAIAGGIAKTIAHYMKLRNDPNRIVKNMFGDVEKLIIKRPLLPMSREDITPF